MVNNPVGIDPTLPTAQQLRLAAQVHNAELLLAENLSHADRHLADAKAEAKATHRLEVTDAERRHREMISKIQLDQLQLRLQLDDDEDQD